MGLFLFLFSTLFLSFIIVFLAVFALLLKFLVLSLCLLGGAIEQGSQLGDILLECHRVRHYGVVLDVCNFELPERDECHQVGLDVLLKQCLCLAVGLPTHPAAQSRHSADFSSQIFPGKGGLASVILVICFLLLFVGSGYVV